MPPQELVRHFGKSSRTYLSEASGGRDESLLVTHGEPKSSSREKTFQKDTDKWEVLTKTLADLVRDIVEDLREWLCLQNNYGEDEVHRF